MNHDSPDHHGMLGMHGFYEANMATYNADLILNIGSRFDDRIVGTYESFPQNKKIIHVDIDAEQLGFYTQLQPDLGIHADAKDFINALR
jgi:acetolactate synthase-1/2/3 large subunit